MDYLSIFAYLGPETILPLTSVLAAIVGVLLTCWRWIIVIFAKVFNFARRGQGAERSVASVDGDSEGAAEGTRS